MTSEPQSVSLKKRFFRHIIVLGLTLFIVFVSVSSFFLFHSTKDRIKKRYHILEKGLARYLETRLIEAQLLLGFLTHQLDKNILEKTNLNEEFPHLLKSHSFLCSLAHFDRKGKLLHFSGKKAGLPREYLDSLKNILSQNPPQKGFWHTESRKSSPPCSGPAFFLPADKNTIAVFLSWDYLWQELKGMFLEKASDAALFDDKGSIVGATFPLDNSASLPALKMKEKLEQGNFHLLPSLSWKLVFYHDPGPVYDFLYRDILQLLLFTAAMLMIFLLATGRFLGKFFIVLKKLVGTTHVVSEGHYDVSIPGKEYGEIYELALNFENMLRSIKWREQKILSGKERLKTTQKLANLGFFEYYPEVDSVVLCESLEDWFCFSQDQRLLSLNEFEEFMRLSSRTLFHETISEVLHNPGNPIFEIEILTPERAIRTLEVRLEPSEDTIPKILGILQDISAQKKIKEEMLEECTARAKAEAANQAKNSLLASVSHELRTPLTSILGMSETLLKMKDRKILDEEKLGYFVKSILCSGEQLSALVDDLLEYSQLEMGTLSLNMQNLHLNKLLEEIIAENDISLKEKGLTLTTSLPRDFHVHSDEDKLRQILSHLLDNAVKFSRESDILLSVSQKQDLVLVTVKDAGTGIAPGHQEQIFEDFVRLDKSGFLPGAGLGLPLSRKLARLMGGDIYLESSSSAGSVFTLSLKSARAEKTSTTK